MSDESFLEEELKVRWECAERLIALSTRVYRTLLGVPTEEAEAALSRTMLTLRSELLVARDEIGLQVDIQEPGEVAEACFRSFRSGVGAIIRGYGSVQRVRVYDLDWSRSREVSNGLRTGVKYLAEVRASRISWMTGVTSGDAFYLAQLECDERAAKGDSGALGEEGITSTIDRLASRYKLKPDHVKFLRAAQKLGATKGVYLSSDRIAEEAFSQRGAICPARLRATLRKQKLLATRRGGGVTLTPEGEQYLSLLKGSL